MRYRNGEGLKGALFFFFFYLNLLLYEQQAAFFFNQIKKAHSITKMTLKYLRYYIDTKVKKKKNDSGIAFHDILHMAC